MKKKIVIGLIIVLVCMALYNKKIYAIIGDVSTDDIKLCTITHVRDNNGGDKLVVDTDEKNEKLEELKKYGYQGDNILYGDNSMKFVTKIHKLADKTAFFEYKIQIGGEIPDGKTGIIKYVSEEDLINKYGYDKNEDTWPVVLIGGAQKDSVPTGELSGIAVVAKKVYAGDDYDKGLQVTTDGGTEVESTDITRASEVIDEVKDALDDVTDIIGNLQIKLYEIKRIPFDGIQSIIDMLQTVNYGGDKWFLPWNITYEGEEISKDDDKNQYVKYTTGSDNLGSEGQKVIFINEKEEGLDISLISKWIFDSEPQIPVIPVDMYTLAKGKVEIFDINFLTGQNNKDLHSDKSGWLIVRNFVSVVIHAIIYIGAAGVIIMMILHGISIVKGTLISEQSTPEKRKKHIGGLHEMAISFIKLIGCVLIMGLCIFMSDAVFEDMKVTDTPELPIRVNVGSGATNGSGNNYSFSTNIIGYVRFMSNISDPSLIVYKALYTGAYIILVIINVFLVLVMFVRLVAIILLSLAGPIIAIAGVFNQEEVFGLTYQDWVKHYAIWASIQLILAITYRILLNVCFPN